MLFITTVLHSYFKISILEQLNPKKYRLRPKLTIFSTVWLIKFLVRMLQCTESLIFILFCS